MQPGAGMHIYKNKTWYVSLLRKLQNYLVVAAKNYGRKKLIL